MSTAPAIYVRLETNPRLTWQGRLMALGIALSALAVLIAAASITPSPTGMSTHTQLGLAPCSFLERTGLPCAGCGMTTSYAWCVRGHFFKAFITQPFGTFLCICTAACFWSALYVAGTGKPSYRLLRMIPMRFHAFFWPGFAIFGWIWKIIAVVSLHH